MTPETFLGAIMIAEMFSSNQVLLEQSAVTKAVCVAKEKGLIHGSQGQKGEQVSNPLFQCLWDKEAG